MQAAGLGDGGGKAGWLARSPARRSGPKLSSVASPLGAGTAGKDRGASGVGPCGRAGVRWEVNEAVKDLKSIKMSCFKLDTMLKCTG